MDFRMKASVTTENKIGSKEDQTCPECGKEGEFVGVRPWRLDQSGQFENTFRCKACAAVWHRPLRN